ncbi:hypothetical protein F4814DRAFT_269528 [Daldinia grandis]|nr:hypothetical protein F4814DRAFT_269528 [Daldinia grandis]
MLCSIYTPLSRSTSLPHRFQHLHHFPHSFTSPSPSPSPSVLFASSTSLSAIFLCISLQLLSTWPFTIPSSSLEQLIITSSTNSNPPSPPPPPSPSPSPPSPLLSPPSPAPFLSRIVHRVSITTASGLRILTHKPSLKSTNSSLLTTLELHTGFGTWSTTSYSLTAGEPSGSRSRGSWYAALAAAASVLAGVAGSARCET